MPKTLSSSKAYKQNYVRPSTLIPLPEDMEIPPSWVKDPQEQSKKAVIFYPEHRDYIYRMIAEGRSLDQVSNALGVTERMMTYRCYKEIERGRMHAAKHGLGRPWKSRVIITDKERNQVQLMASKGLGTTDMCQIMGYAYKTFIAYFQEDIEHGKSRGKEKVATAAFDMAIDKEHPTVTTFWLKTQMGWKETAQIEFPDEYGIPQSLSGPGITMNLNADRIQTIVALLNEQV